MLLEDLYIEGDRTQTYLKGWAKPLAGVTRCNPTDLHGAALIYANRVFVPTFHDEERLLQHT